MLLQTFDSVFETRSQPMLLKVSDFFIAFLQCYKILLRQHIFVAIKTFLSLKKKLKGFDNVFYCDGKTLSKHFNSVFNDIKKTLQNYFYSILYVLSQSMLLKVLDFPQHYRRAINIAPRRKLIYDNFNLMLQKHSTIF